MIPNDELRPLLMVDFMGQEQIKDRLIVMSKAAQQRGRPLGHVLLYGPEGVGKKTLVSCFARYMDIPARIISATSIRRPSDLAAILSNLAAGEILTIDHIDKLPRQVAEVLYPVMDDFTLDLTIGAGSSARSLSLSLSHFTVFAIAPDIREMPPGATAHFAETLHLDYYPHEALQAIVVRSARLLSIPIDAASAGEIARHSKGLPMQANRLLRRVRDYTQVKGSEMITAQLVRDALGLDSRNGSESSCDPAVPSQPIVPASGVVYLLRAGPWYKIGKSTDPTSRYRQLAIQLPEKPELVHEIRTTDTHRLERHWHRYFAARRANGEWFALTDEDVAEFRSFHNVD